MPKKLLNKNSGAKTLYMMLIPLAIVLTLLINIVAGGLVSRFGLEFDLSANSAFGIDQQTIDYISQLEDSVKIQVLTTKERFVANSNYNAQAAAVMEDFALHGKNIELIYVDYTRDPAFAGQYSQYELKEGDVIVESQGKSRHIPTQDLFNYVTNQTGAYEIESSKAEQAILSALLGVVSTDMPQVAVISGHGESLPEAFSELLLENNFELRGLQLSTEEIPAEIDLIMISAPQNDFSEQELQKLDAFLENGGQYGKTVFYTTAAEIPPLPNLELFLEEWGIAIGEGAVFETDEGRVFNYHPFYAVADYVDEQYTALIANPDVPFLAPISKPLELVYESRDERYTTTLLEFGASSGVRPGDAGEDFVADDAEQKGPMPAVVLSSHKVRDSANATNVVAMSSVLVSGSTDILQNYALENPSFSNSNYLIQLLNELCAREDVITITPKQLSAESLNITQQTADTIGGLFVFVFPAVVLVLGLVMWLIRRHK